MDVDLKNIIYKKEIKQDNPKLPFWVVLTLETNLFLIIIYQDGKPSRLLGAYPLPQKDLAIQEAVTVSTMHPDEILRVDWWLPVYPNFNAGVAQG